MTHPEPPLYEPFDAAFESHATVSAYNAHYDRPAMLNLIGDASGRRVLDVGCGPGLYAEELIARGALVTGFDSSPEMVSLARARLGEAADLRVWSSESPLSWAGDESYDLALMALVVHHLQNRSLALSEIFRVLRPEGRLYLSTTHPTEDWLRTGGSYFDKAMIEETWQDDWAVKYWKQPLQDWCADFTEAGFLIERLVEPRPSPTMNPSYPDVFEQLNQRPGFIAFSLLKPGA